MRIIYPIALTLLAFAMLANFMSTGVEFTIPLFSFGFCSGIAIASWTSYIHDN